MSAARSIQFRNRSASGEVAFIVGNYTSITLTPREQAVYTRLVNRGYPVHLITAYNRTTTDYTQAAFVVQVEALSYQHPDFYNGLLANGKSVLLLSDASRVLSVDWNYPGGIYHDLVVMNNAAYLSDYANDSSNLMETGGSHYVFLGSAIPDWTGIGHDVSLYNTAFYYTGSGSGRGVILSYDPEYYTADGEHVFSSSVGYVNTGELPTSVPIANFTANVTYGAIPLNVHFTDLRPAHRIRGTGISAMVTAQTPWKRIRCIRTIYPEPIL